MKDAPPKATYLKDYKKTPYTIPAIDLVFELDDRHTIVTSKTTCVRNEGAEDSSGTITLAGEGLKLLKVSVDGQELKASDYEVDDTSLTLKGMPESFSLEIQTEINPLANTALDGLYKSGDLFCTQNEPEGFRRITYFLDRPDVMARYTTKIIADKKKYPILLSNGNLIDRGDLAEGKHWVLWEDPFPKPSYLYALVAGDLGCIKDSFVTKSGRNVDLLIYCDKGNESKCHHAMRSLKKSMKWDEDVFGLEYDLDIFMIVAVDAFNFGAMENKGLNIFNTSCVLADEKSATDDNFTRVEGVVAHEYFHNWTGNRVTCRDWFQLTLKEGLTVFRDQEFSSDMNSRPVKRIEDVIALRAGQFQEDEGPTSHPIKPKSYIEINNFYTTTIYNKGAEIIRMIQTLIGKEAFRKGIDTYFELFDGQAVTTEDFLFAMEKASGMDLKAFSKWYHQSGTPVLEIKFEYNEEEKEFILDITQINKPTADQKEKESLYFPLSIGLLDQEGNDMAIVSEQAKRQGDVTYIIVSQEHERFTFKEVTERPVPSLNRNFSAPIRIHAPYSREDQIFLMSHDSDPFNRWDAAQELATLIMIEQVENIKEGGELVVDEALMDAFGAILHDGDLDVSLKAKALVLPSEGDLAQRQRIIDVEGNFTVREAFCNAIAEKHYDALKDLYHTLHDNAEFKIDAASMGRRQLKNVCLSYMVRTYRDEAIDLCFHQFLHATNMTDEFFALAILANTRCPQSEQALKMFYDKWNKDTLVMCKWLSVQASSKLDGALERVEDLSKDPVYVAKIPNLVRALFGSFVENHRQFHAKSGEGYVFIGEKVRELDKINPHAAARIAGGFKKYRKLDLYRREAMKEVITRILETKPLSPHVYEIVSKCMA